MQKEIKGKRKISTARPKKKTTSQTLIKKRLPEKRTNVNNNKVDQSKIKKRIKIVLFSLKITRKDFF